MTGFNVTEKNPQACERLRDSERRDLCYNMVAVNSKNPTYCELIAGLDQKNICYSGMVTATGNRSLCDKIQGTWKSGWERENCITKPVGTNE